MPLLAVLFTLDGDNVDDGAPPMADLTELPPAHLEHDPAPNWARVFHECDGDRDGRLRHSEISQCLRRGLQLITARQRIQALLDREQHLALQRGMARADANKDGGVDRAELAREMGANEHSAKVQALWRVSDTNRDGKLSVDELLLRYRPALAMTTDEGEEALHNLEVHKMLEAYDVNNDSFVSWREYEHALTSRLPDADPRDESAAEADRAAFARADRDGDRELSTSELREMARTKHTPDWDAEAHELLELIDGDRDGKLSVQEFEERFGPGNAHLLEVLQEHAVRRAEL